MWCPVGEDGGSQTGWLGGEEAQKEPKPCEEECEGGGGGGEHAMDTWAEEAPLDSDVLSLENMVMASGKLGGVAGVLRGVHI